MTNFIQIAYANGGEEVEAVTALDFSGPLIALGMIVAAIIIAKIISKKKIT